MFGTEDAERRAVLRSQLEHILSQLPAVQWQAIEHAKALNDVGNNPELGQIVQAVLQTFAEAGDVEQQIKRAITYLNS
jgi:hypothetical protein